MKRLRGAKSATVGTKDEKKKVMGALDSDIHKLLGMLEMVQLCHDEDPNCPSWKSQGRRAKSPSAPRMRRCRFSTSTSVSLRSGGALLAVEATRAVAPLALAAAKSVPFDSLVATDQLFADRTGEIYHLAYDARQEWFYAPEMTPEEVILIKGWDSLDDGCARFTPHGAVVLDRPDESLPPLPSTLPYSTNTKEAQKKYDAAQDQLTPALSNGGQGKGFRTSVPVTFY